ncbi:unnamed protein product [Rhodiola kirilowii]
MKIQCDVCAAEQATVFCTADEAALCDRSDHKVHQANKLAKKHRRFSLVHPSCNEAPLCDICQEKKAFLFCKDDRAISCRECDFSIHQANELTQMHHRYLLTGVKLSPPHPSTNSQQFRLPARIQSSRSRAQNPLQEAEQIAAQIKWFKGVNQSSLFNNSANSSNI